MEELTYYSSDWLEESNRKLWQARINQLRQELRQYAPKSEPPIDSSRPRLQKASVQVSATLVVSDEEKQWTP